MEYISIGSGSAVNAFGKANACQLLKFKNKYIAIDMGPTTLMRLKQENISTSEISHIFITHIHGDHAGGLLYFLLDRFVSNPDHAVTIIGPTGVKETLEMTTTAMYNGLEKEIIDPNKVKFIEVQMNQTYDVDNITLETFQADHFTGKYQALMLKLTLENKTAFFSGDTVWTPNIIDYTNNVDLAVLDVMFVNASLPYHIVIEDLRENLSKINAKKIYITHSNKKAIQENPEFSFMLTTKKVTIINDGLRDII